VLLTPREGILEKIVTERETVFEGVGAAPASNRSRHVDHFGHRLPTDLVIGLAKHFVAEGRAQEANELLRLGSQ
jgi:hypothetical protein